MKNHLIILLLILSGCAQPPSNHSPEIIESEQTERDNTTKEDTLQIIIQDGAGTWNSLDTVSGLTIEDYFTSSEALYLQYAPLIKDSLVGITATSTDKLSQHQRTYLGKLTDLETEENYHIITDFWTLQLAISKKGHSEIVFIQEDNHYVARYDPQMPEQLPVAIENNVLIFNDNNAQFGLQFSNGLPLHVCTPQWGCFPLIENE